jgi:hypothetical protein
MLRETIRGAAAGAAGVTALNAVTYLDMTWRARPASSSPQDTVQKLAERGPGDIPGDGEERDNRLAALGPLSGLLVGTAVGALYGAARAAGVRPPVWAGALLTAAAAMAVADGPMAALGVTDPRTWSSADWLTDLGPHLAYGAVTAATYAATEH